MGLYQLKNTKDNIEAGFVEKVKSDAIDYERYFESWLENSPSLLLDDDEEGNTVLWIGRQVKANVGDAEKFPDLIGIDASGDLVLVELKKGKTPREVIAQILEYAAWGALLDYNALDDLARNYYMKDDFYGGKSLKDIYMDVFDIEAELAIESFFNRKQKLYIVAEEVSPVVRQVSEHLRDCYKMNINHLEYQVLKTKEGEYLLSIEKVLGFDSIKPNEFKPGVSISKIGWSGSEKVKDVVYKAVLEVTNGNENTTFTNKDVIRALLQKYPETNTTTVRCQIIQDCVNHTSRKHYPSGQKDLYFKEGNVYRLYVEERDGKWDWEGNRIQ